MNLSSTAWPLYGLMSRYIRPSRYCCAVAITVLSLMLFCVSTNADSTWTGNGSSNHWSDTNNWDVLPTNGAALVFTGTKQLSNVNDLLSSVGNVTFNSGGWHISGNPVTKSGEFIVASGGGVDWAIDTELVGQVIIRQTYWYHNLTLSGVLSGSGSLLRYHGTDSRGELRITGTNNTFTGSATLGENTMFIKKLANAGLPSSVGAATGSAALIYLGTTGSSYGSYLRINADTDCSTDRPFMFSYRYAASCGLYNDSPNNSDLSFHGHWINNDHYLGANTLILGGSSYGRNTMYSVIENSDYDKNLAVDITGNGTWVFAGTNLFSEGTTLSTTLLANTPGASATGPGSVTINAGGVLGGIGRVIPTGANVVNLNSGGVISPGDPLVSNGVGELYIGSDLIITNGAALHCDTGVGVADLCRIDGTLRIMATNVTIAVTCVGEEPADTEWAFPIMSATSIEGADNVAGWSCTNQFYKFTAFVIGNEVWVKRPAPGFVLIIN